MTTGEVVGRVFLAADELLRVEELAVGPGSDLVDHGGLQVHEDGTWHVLSSTCLAEEGVEGIISTANGLVTRHLPIRRKKSGPDSGRTAAIWEAGGYTSGSGTLSDEVLRAAGLRNLAAQTGLAGGGYLALERLVMERPDLILSSSPWPGASRAEDLLRHPALVALMSDSAALVMRDADWVCGLPQILTAVEGLKGAVPQ